MSDAILRKFAGGVHLSEAEKTAISGLMSQTLTFHSREDMVREGERPNHSMVLLEGLACRYRTTPGGVRQILAFQMAGDWVDLQSYLLRTMDHSLQAISACRVALVPFARLDQLTATHPHLIKALWRDTMIDSAVFREWVVNVGARDARQRIAHLLCEVHSRMLALGLATPTEFSFPITQQDLAESVGISTVHTNRSLQSLREEGLLEFRRGVVTLPQPERLRQVAQFDDGYLHAHEGPDDVVRESVDA